MDKKMANGVAELYAECFREIYDRLGLSGPELFEPMIEADRIIEAARQSGSSITGLSITSENAKMDYEHNWRLSYIDRALQALALINTGRETTATNLLENHILPYLKENK